MEKPSLLVFLLSCVFFSCSSQKTIKDSNRETQDEYYKHLVNNDAYKIFLIFEVSMKDTHVVIEDGFNEKIEDSLKDCYYSISTCGLYKVDNSFPITLTINKLKHKIPLNTVENFRYVIIYKEGKKTIFKYTNEIPSYR